MFPLPLLILSRSASAPKARRLPRLQLWLLVGWSTSYRRANTSRATCRKLKGRLGVSLRLLWIAFQPRTATPRKYSVKKKKGTESMLHMVFICSVLQSPLFISSSGPISSLTAALLSPWPLLSLSRHRHSHLHCFMRHCYLLTREKVSLCRVRHRKQKNTWN